MNGPDRGIGPELDRSFSGTTSSLNDARLTVAGFLHEHHASTAIAEDAALVTSELATNAIEAAPDQPYRVQVRVLPDAIQVTVHNRAGSPSSGVPSQRDWGPAEVLSRSGRGLSIVRALSESIRVEGTGDGGTKVVVRLARRASR